jgi:hypothetical protein
VWALGCVSCVADESFSKACLAEEAAPQAQQVAAGGGAMGEEGSGDSAAALAATAAAGYEGAWKLACSPPGPAVSSQQVAAALKQLQQKEGGSSLLSRVRQVWKEQGRVESTDRLLKEAAQLGLLPANSAYSVGGGSGSGDATKDSCSRGCGLLASLLQQRRLALVAAEAGDSSVPATPAVCLPLPACQLDWSEFFADSATRAAGGSSSQTGEQQHLQHQQQQLWEQQRDAALGVPPAPPHNDVAAAYEGTVDVLTGEPLPPPVI